MHVSLNRPWVGAGLLSVALSAGCSAPGADSQASAITGSNDVPANTGGTDSTLPATEPSVNEPDESEADMLDLTLTEDRETDVESCGSNLTGIVRDFKKIHPDFEDLDAVGKCFCSDTAIVGPMLGEDGKPVYAGNPDTMSTTGKVSFDQWFNDDPTVNMSRPLELEFTTTETGALTYESAEFFPIDGELFGNEELWHNFSFTYELHTTFLYRGDETFTFRGDDDVFTYINGHLVVNLGGIHDVQEATVVLKDEEQRLGLVVGEVYPLDFFFAERHCCASNFRIDTSLEFVDCGIIR